MRSLKYLILIFTLSLLSCSNEEEHSVSSPNLSNEKELKTLVFELNGEQYTTTINTSFVLLNKALPYGTTELLVSLIELSEKATSDITEGILVDISTGNTIIKIHAEDLSERLYTLVADFENQSYEVTPFDPVPVSKSNTLPCYAHYMPWFATKNQSDVWNHWGSEPEIILSNDQNSIPTVYYPSIGLYDSNDPDYLEYAFLNMKLSGLDGVFIDYYTNTDLFDFRLNLERTISAMNLCDKVGLKYAIVYEDWTLNAAEDEGLGTQLELLHGHLEYLKTNIFNRSNYLKHEGKSLFMIFGPQSKLSGPEWRSAITNDITLVGVNWMVTDSISDFFDGVMSWTALSSDAKNSLENCQSNYELCIASAMPGFETVRDGWPYVDPRNGENFREGLQFALDAYPDFLQIPTWNDWEEGTIIEPSIEFGYQRLEIIQEFLGVDYSADELEIIKLLYQKRKEHKGKTFENKLMDQIFYFLISLQIEEARSLLVQL